MRLVRLCNEDIYDALIDDECLADLPARLAAAFGGRSALIHWTFPDGGVEILSQSDYFSEEFLTRYSHLFAPHDPWLNATESGEFMNRAMSLDEVVPDHEYGGSFFYNEFIRAIGDDTFRCLGVRVVNRWGSGIVAIHRGRHQPAFDVDAVDALEDYVAPLRRMLAVRGRLAAANRRLRSMETILDHLGEAALLVRHDGTLAHANAVGEALLHEADALVLRRGILAASASRSTMRLRQAIDAACSPDGMGASALLIERAAGRPLAVSIVPLRSPYGDRSALIIAERESNASEAAPRLQALYRLTPAEAEIGIRLADGVSPQWIANERGVSVETVRSQIKSLSAKLGCARQSEIVALIRGLPAANLAGREPPPLALPPIPGGGRRIMEG